MIPLNEIIAAVRATGYRGAASVEISRPSYWRHQPLAVAKEAKVKAKHVLAK